MPQLVIIQKIFTDIRYMVHILKKEKNIILTHQPVIMLFIQLWLILALLKVYYGHNYYRVEYPYFKN